MTEAFRSNLSSSARDNSARSLAPKIANTRVSAEEHLGPLPRTVWQVDCRGAHHLVVLVDGLPFALDHDATELRREQLLAELTGTPIPSVRALGEARRLTAPAEAVAADPPDGLVVADLFG
nr:hypothetical protein [Micromonospora sp. DSM 115978]